MTTPTGATSGSDVSALGKRLTTYGFSVGAVVGFLFMIVCFIGMGGAMVIGSMTTLGSYDSGTAIFLLIAGLIFLALGAGFGLLLWRALKRRIELYSGGLVYSDPKGRIAVRWEDINAVYQQITRTRVSGMTTNVSYSYTITTTSGQRLALGSGVKDIKSLGERIQRKVYDILLPQMLARFQAGETLNFGRLTLSQVGIGDGTEVVPWNEVKAVKLNNGIITVNRQGKWLSWTSVPVAETPNVFIFLALVDQIVGIKTR